jgi:hypothetical protein
VRPTLFPACLICSYCLLLSFSFFPQVEVSLSRGLCCSGQACLWEYRSTAKLTWFTSSQAVWAPVTGGPGALLVSPFNVRWRFSVPAGGGGVKIMPFLSDYACKMCLQCLSKISL